MIKIKKEEKKKSNPPVEEKLTSAQIEANVKKLEGGGEEIKKRGRRTKAEIEAEKAETPEYVKIMFKPIIIGIHNGLLKVLKLSVMTPEQEVMTVEGYSQILHKRLPNIIEKHGDIIAGVGATAYVFMAKLMSETKLFDSKGGNDAEQHNGNTGKEGVGENHS